MPLVNFERDAATYSGSDGAPRRGGQGLGLASVGSIMRKIRSSVRQFVRQEAGVTAIEYALMAAVLVAAIVAGFVLLGPAVKALYAALHGQLAAAR